CVSVICHLMPHLVRHAYKQLLVRLVSTQIVFFFSSGRRYTIFSRDWSSDVCSSDLSRPGPSTGSPKAGAPASPSGSVWPTKGREIGRASWRERMDFAFDVGTAERKQSVHGGD